VAEADLGMFSMFDRTGAPQDSEYHSSCWRAFRGYQHRWPWTTL